MAAARHYGTAPPPPLFAQMLVDVWRGPRPGARQDGHGRPRRAARGREGRQGPGVVGETAMCGGETCDTCDTNGCCCRSLAAGSLRQSLAPAWSSPRRGNQNSDHFLAAPPAGRSVRLAAAAWYGSGRLRRVSQRRGVVGRGTWQTLP